MISEKEINTFQKAQDILSFSFTGTVVDNSHSYFCAVDFSNEIKQISSTRNSDYNISHYLWGICKGNVEEIISRLEDRKGRKKMQRNKPLF
jgi:hypothetical protein